MPQFMPEAESIEQAKERYLRTFCDTYFPQIVDLAKGGNQDAVSLLVFSARHELQTPRPSEMTVTDYWNAMREIDASVEASAAASKASPTS